MEIALQLLLVVFLVALNGFFVAAEFAIVKLRPSQLEELLAQGDVRAVRVKRIIGKLDAYLSAVQVGITLASLALGWVGEPATAALLQPVFHWLDVPASVGHTISIAVGFLVITVLHIVIGELLPKSIAISYEKSVSLWVAKPLDWFYILFKPLIWTLNKAVGKLLHAMGMPVVTESHVHSREELRSVLAESAKHGVMERNESEIIASIFEFKGTTAREIMIHRTEIVAMDLDSEPREVMRIIQEEGFSRIPVYRGSIDEILGILYVRDLLPNFSQLERLSVPSQNAHKEFFAMIERVLRPALFVSETQTLERLLLEFQKERMHLGVVVSEHGGVEGLVTLEDILEELVGEIRDESDVNEERDVIEIADTLYIDPMMPVADFNNRFGDKFGLLEESNEYSTLSGFVQKQSGRIPNVNDTIEVNGLTFTVTRKVRHRLQQIKIERTPVSEPAQQDDTEAS
ncbi:MAG TPA: hemolysin family protein [Candidatus Kapabacteria bacterium]|nr:hemolysin family protein [Candidatus Kapabacteria bacterium]